MNDRLADVLSDVPDWANEGKNQVSSQTNSKEKSSNALSDHPETDPAKSAWFDESDDECDGDLEMGKPNGAVAQQAKYMDAFFKDVDNIKDDIEAVKGATKRVGEISEAAIMSTSTAKEEQLSQELKPLIEATNKRAKRTKNLLALLKEENAKLKGEDAVKDSDMRIRENLCNTLTRKFIDEMKLYQQSQQKYKSDIRKKVKRQVQIVQPDATDADIDAVMRSENGREDLYKERILAGRVNSQITGTYAKVAGKYQDVLTLEASVAELHQMFLDFALLTEQQGELIDQIEFQVRSAGDYVEAANVEVFQAIEYQKSSRKKQCWIIAILLIVVVVLLFALRIIP